MRRVVALAFAWFVLAGGSAAFGQIHGVPATVTSVGRFGSFPPGPAPSVTSLGPLGWQAPCCAVGGGFSFGQSTFAASRSGHPHRHHRFDNGTNAFGAFYMPIYIPYYPYVPLYSDSAVEEPATAMVRTQPAAVDSATDLYTQSRAANAPSPPPAPVKASAPAEQDATVLVFRDGHRLQVHNYAIVGRILYRFDSGTHKYPLSDLDLDATRKVNDDLGNEFHLPGQ